MKRMRRTLGEYQIENYGKKLVINLGCGRNNPESSFGVDIIDCPGVDMVADLSKSIPLPDNTFDVAFAVDFLEHIPQGAPNIKIMEEIYRILKPGGFLSFEVPSTDGCNIGAFQDPTHVSFWNQMKINYFLKDEFGKGFRSLYDIKCFFEPVSIKTHNNEWGVTYVTGTLKK